MRWPTEHALSSQHAYLHSPSIYPITSPAPPPPSILFNLTRGPLSQSVRGSFQQMRQFLLPGCDVPSVLILSLCCFSYTLPPLTPATTTRTPLFCTWFHSPPSWFKAVNIYPLLVSSLIQNGENKLLLGAKLVDSDFRVRQQSNKTI